MGCEARELSSRKGGSGSSGSLTVTRGEHGYGFIVKAGGSREQVNSAEAGRLAVEKYKRDGFKYDATVLEK